MASETSDDNMDESGDRLAESSKGDPITYEEISFTDQPGFKPMIGIGMYVLITFFLLTGLPMYAEPGDSALTLFTYTSVLWGIAIIFGGFIYEYWLMKIEGRGW